MPRNISGNYTLPLAPVVSGSIIESAWANDTLDDIAAALTQSLDRNGNGGMTSAFRIVDGSEAQPALAFVSEPSTGLYLQTEGVMSVSVQGSEKMTWSSVGVTVAGNATVTGDFTAQGELSVFGDFNLQGDLSIIGQLGLDGDLRLFNGRGVLWGTSTPASTSITGTDAAGGLISFFTNTLERVRITNAGNVGIGGDPLCKLDVYGQLRSAATGVSGVSLIGGWPSGNGSGIQFYQDTIQEWRIYNPHVSSDLRFSNGVTDKFWFYNDSCIGIGLPAARSDLMAIYTQKTICAASPSPLSAAGFEGVGAPYDGVTYGGCYVFSYGLSWKPFTDATQGPSAALSGYGGVRLFAGNVERFRINHPGNVKIGAGDANARLHIDALGNSEVIRLQGATPYISVYDASNSTRYGYFQITPTEVVIASETGNKVTVRGSMFDYAGGNPIEYGWKSLPQNGVSAFYEIQATDNGKHIMQNAVQAVRIPAGLPIGHITTIYNNCGSPINIQQGSGLNLRWANGAGTEITGTRTLAAFGTCTFYMITNGGYAVLTGVGLT